MWIECLILINVIVALVFRTGFPYELDRIASKRFPLHHIPEKPFLCSTCMSFWCGAAFLLISGNFSLFSLCLALFFADIAQITNNLIALVEGVFSKIINVIIKFLDA